jgi:hypothetical protein
MPGAYVFACRALFLEAVLFVATGLILGVVWRSWEAVVAGQLVLLAAEMCGYAIEQHLHSRRRRSQARW